MAKKKQVQIPDDIFAQLATQAPLESLDYQSTGTEQFTPAYGEYQSSIDQYAIDEAIASGVYYDENMQPQSTGGLDESGFLDSGVGDTGKLLRITDDIIYPDGTTASERITKDMLAQGWDPETAAAVGKDNARINAQQNRQLTESIADVLDLVGLGTMGRAIAGAAVNEKKLIPYFHPQLQKWVAKVATQDDFDAGAATMSAYGPRPESDNFINAFYKGFSNSMGSLPRTSARFFEWIGDLGEAGVNSLTGNGFVSENDWTDRLADRLDEAYKSVEQQVSINSQENFFSPEGLSNGIGSGLASLVQYATIGGIATGFGSLTGKTAAQFLGTQGVNGLAKAGMLTAGMVLNGGEAYDQAKEAGLDEEDAALLALATGAINTAIELKVGGNQLQEWLVGSKAAKEIPRIILEETGGNLSNLNNASKNIMRRAIDSFDAFTKIPVLGTALEEGSEEFMQSLVGSTGQMLYNYFGASDNAELGKGMFDPKNLGEVFTDAFQEATIGALVGGISGALARNSIAEKKTIMPFIAQGKEDLIKSSLGELLEKGMIDGNQYQAYVDRVDQLSNIWNTNSSVFQDIAKNNNVDPDVIKSNALDLIDQEFELKQQQQSLLSKIGEIKGDSNTSDAVKDEKVKQVQLELNGLNTKVANIKAQIADLIPDENGNIRAARRVNAFNELQQAVLSEANNIIPINEEEFNTLFNFSDSRDQFSSLLNRATDEGITPEIRQELFELTGLNNRDAFIQNVVNTREAITKARQEEANRAKQEEERAVKRRQEEIKEKAAQVKKTEIAENKPEPNVEEEDDLIFSEATLQDDEGNVISQPQISPSEEVSSESDNITLEDKIADIERRRQEELAQVRTTRGLIAQQTLLPEVNAKYDAEIAALNSEETTDVFGKELTSEESVVAKALDYEDTTNSNKETNSDGYVTNVIDESNIKSELKTVDLTNKRTVGNTIISLNINYKEATNVTSSTEEYSILDEFTESGRLDINSNFDSRLQDPNQFNAGTEVNIIIPTYEQIVAKGVQDYTEEQYNSDILNPNTLPIAFVDNDNNIIGYLPTTDNVRRRVADEYVADELDKNSRLRAKIFNNRDTSNFKSIITRKSSGTPMFQSNYVSLYNALGDGTKLADNAKVAIYKNGGLKVNISNNFQGKIKLPEDVYAEEYFQEGVIYAVVPTADGTTNFAIPMRVNNIGSKGANTILKMLQLYKANPNYAGDSSLINERNQLSNEIDLSNFTELSNALENIVYINNNDDRFILRLTKDKLLLGMTGDTQFTWNDIKSNQSVRDRIVEILSNRAAAVKLSNFGSSYTSYEVNDQNVLEPVYHNNYFDYLDNNQLVTSDLQGEPISNKENQRYFTAQSVIEIADVTVDTPVFATKESEPVKSVPKSPKNKLGVKIKPNKNKPDISEDFEVLPNTDLSLDQQVNDLMKLCGGGK